MPPNTLPPADRVPVNPATGSPLTAARSRGEPAAISSTRTRVSGAIPSSGDRPLPSTRLIGVVTPSRRSSVTIASAAPANVAGSPIAIARCLAMFSAITLLLSSSICPAIADSGGELTLASTGALAGAVAGDGLPLTAMPSRRSRSANADTVRPTGSVVRGAKLSGSSESCNAPPGVSRPWSASSASIGVTFPV